MTPGPVTFTVAKPADTTAQWKHLDLAGIAAQLKATGVYAPADEKPGLEKVVAKAAANGDALHVVVLDEGFQPWTVNRDIATRLQSEVGGTVIVISPSGTGTASSEFSRVELEDGTYQVKTGSDRVVAVQRIYDQASAPHVDWTAVTIVFIVVVIIGAVIARMSQLRQRRKAAASTGESPNDAVETATDDAVETTTDDAVETPADDARDTTSEESDADVIEP